VETGAHAHRVLRRRAGRPRDPELIAWLADAPHRYGLGVFSAGFLIGALGMYIAAYLYGYRKVT